MAGGPVRQARSVEQAADTAAEIYLRNIFPEMKVNWSVHPNNLGHNDFPGCFRCYDGSHNRGRPDHIQPLF